MPLVTIKQLVEAGVHFGHPASRWHPRMEPFIFAKRNRVHIIDLRKTVAAIVEAYHFLRRVARERGTILYVGTKRQAKETVRREAERVGMPFVSERWLGGTLTNLNTIRQQIRHLEDLERIEQSAELSRYSKKALASFRREKRRVVRNLEGIRTMGELPRALLIVDPGTERIAVKEANKLRIPVVAMLDTDADPLPIDIPIPANDDAMRSVDSIITLLTDAIAKGREEKTGAPPRVDVSKGFSTSDLDSIGRTASPAKRARPAAKDQPPAAKDQPPAAKDQPPAAEGPSESTPEAAVPDQGESAASAEPEEPKVAESTQSAEQAQQEPPAPGDPEQAPETHAADDA